ncbi:MAG: PAS domain S-box protein, partial [Acidiferrobacteraceae bacterium]
MDKTLLHLLIIGEAAEDGDVLARLFRESRYLLKTQRVADRSGLTNMLSKNPWDVIVARDNLPHLGVDTALEVLHRSGLDIPFIVFSSAMKTGDTVRLMELGAHDVVSSKEPERLIAIITRELGAAEAKRAAKIHEQARNELELKLRVLSDTIGDAVCYSQDGMHVETNPAYLRLFGYGALEELEGIPVLNLVAGADQGRIKDCFRRAARGEDVSQPFSGVHKDGSLFPAEMRIRTMQLRGEPCQQITVYDRAAQTVLPVATSTGRDAVTGLMTRAEFVAAAATAAPGDSSLVYFNVRDLRTINRSSG